MFQLALFFLLNQSFAQGQIQGLQQKTYTLKTLTEELRGVKAVAKDKSRRSHLCGETIRPKIKTTDGEMSLSFNARMIFGWREFNANTEPDQEGCRLPSSGKIEKTGIGTVLTITNLEECPSDRRTDSMRETIQLNGEEIIYTNESLVKVRGQWTVDSERASFTCLWTASGGSAR